MWYCGYKNILLTGEPGCGKSTLLKELISSVQKKVWLITEEILDGSWKREWFKIITSGKEEYLLASRTELSHILFWEKYWIQIEWIKKLISTLIFEIWDILYLDEIAPMQLYAPGFKKFVKLRLSSPNPLLWVIKLDDEKYPFIREIKKRKDVLVVNISETNDMYNKEFLVKLVGKMVKSQKYLQEKVRFTKLDDNTRIMNSSSAQRNLTLYDNNISCDCDFYINYGICSHTIALRQLI